MNQPVLLTATAFADDDIGAVGWDSQHHDSELTVSEGGAVISWEPRSRPTDEHPPAWVPAPTLLRLHSGEYRWDFGVEALSNGQIGVGFMLLWDIGSDWGFFGYLGSSPTAWSYDPSTGDVVTATKSIDGGLPQFSEQQCGVVSVQLNVPRRGAGEARFEVAGTASRPIELPESAVVLPAACLLGEGQRVRLSGFERS